MSEHMKYWKPKTNKVEVTYECRRYIFQRRNQKEKRREDETRESIDKKEDAQIILTASKSNSIVDLKKSHSYIAGQ